MRKTDTPKIKALQQFYETAKLHIKRSKAEPRVIKISTGEVDEKHESRRQGNRWHRYNDVRGAAIRLRETYPDLPNLPASSPDPLLGLQDLWNWANVAQKNKDHYIALTVAVKNYEVSRATLKRYKKELNAYKQNNILYVDSVEVAKRWNLRKSSPASNN
jgi:hypothetical protein